MSRPTNWSPKAEERYRRRVGAYAAATAAQPDAADDDEAKTFAHLPPSLRPRAVMARMLAQAGTATDATDTDRKDNLSAEAVVRRLLGITPQNSGG